MTSEYVNLRGRLKFVLQVHDRVRRDCFPASLTKEAHFVNENTVVRLAAMMEATGLKPRGKANETTRWPEHWVRTLFFLRNIIVHATDGYFRPQNLPREMKDKYLDSFRRFCKRHPEADVGEGEKLCLAYKEVLAFLVHGCEAYARGKCLTRPI